MTLLLNPYSSPDEWKAAFETQLPDADVRVWPDAPDPEQVEYISCVLLPDTDLSTFTNLRAILAMSAGVEQFRDLDPSIPVVRLADDVMSQEMAAYAVHWVTHFQRRFDAFIEQQRSATWEELPYTQAADFPIGILGYGTIGSVVAEAFAQLRYPVNAWSRTPKNVPGVTTFAGADQIDDFLGASKAVVNVLPNTPDTFCLMNESRFRVMPAGSIYVTIGRGWTTDGGGLLAALDDHLGAAVLDVTYPEPLPSDSPLWGHPKVRITPHVSGYTQVTSASQLIADNIRRIENGADPFPLLDRSRGY